LKDEEIARGTDGILCEVLDSDKSSIGKTSSGKLMQFLVVLIGHSRDSLRSAEMFENEESCLRESVFEKGFELRKHEIEGVCEHYQFSRAFLHKPLVIAG